MKIVCLDRLLSEQRPKGLRYAAGLGLAVLLTLPAGAASAQTWIPQGPGPNTEGQTEGIEDGEVTGAVHTVAAHPKAAGTLYIGAVNGGVWVSHNTTSQNPKWTRLTDDQMSNSIGALEFDPTDVSHKTLVAGFGRFSSFASQGGARLGLLRTTDGGTTWTLLNGGGTLIEKNISGVAARGNVLVASVNTATPNTFGNIGIWRSADGGATFQQISQGNGTATGLPGGITHDLVGDPNNPSRLFTSVVFADSVGGVNGVYRSDDTGATWTKVSNPAMDALLTSGITNNVEFAVGRHNNVYAAIVRSGVLADVFRSGDGGNTWTSLGVPLTNDGAPTGVHPGRQGSIHLGIVADPGDANIVYVSGDRQPLLNELLGGPYAFPNSIGAEDYTGRIFRGNATLPAASRWVHITHTATADAPAGGTASHTSPHADSREMTFNARGELIETDDGGIYKRTNPRSNAGDWYTLIGDLQSTELHDVAYDSLSNIVFGGAQDTGVPVQDLPGDVTHSSLLTADGGDVAVDDFSTPGLSTRYSSNQNLLTFNRSYWDGANNFVGYDFPTLIVLSGPTPQRQFVTTLAVNSADADRIVFGFRNGVYESFDRGDTLRQLNPPFTLNTTGLQPLAYGAADNADVIYAGSGTVVFVRTAPPPAPLVATVSFPAGQTVSDIAIDPDSGNHAIATNLVGVHRTTNGGATWTDITGNLQSFAPSTLRSVVFANTPSGDAVIVGTQNGIFFATAASGFTSWQRLGNGMPTVPVYDLDYDSADDLLVAGTMGRGSWKLLSLSSAILAGGL